MRKRILYFLSGLALIASASPAQAQSAAVATVPEGMITYSFAGGTTSYLSLPLTNNVTYTSAVTAVTSNSISVGDTPAPFTTNLATPSAPYFVKFLSGSETGRILLITANTTSTLTLSLTDNTTQSVSLTTAGFSVAVGDTFEIFPADTLASVFGNNTSQNPLVLKGGSSQLISDSVGIYSPTLSRFQSYYFNTTRGYWEIGGFNVNANNTILYPNGALSIRRRANFSTVSLVLVGRVTEVPAITKTIGNNTVVYASTGYADNLTLSQLQFGSNWIKGTSAQTADVLGVWDAALGTFDTYFQEPDSTWRKSTNAVTDQSNFVITAGTAITILQRGVVSGASSFLASTLPYSLN